MTIVAFASQRGGVGTTTSAVTVAYGLAQAGYRTLLVDLQMLAQCAFSLGLESAPTVYEWLISKQPALSRTITIQNGLRLLRGDYSTTVVNRYYNRDTFGREWLVDEFRYLDPDSWIVIDTPRGQTLGEAVIEAADIVVIPFRGDPPSWHGVLATMELIERLGSTAKVILLPTLFDLRQRLARHYLDEAQRLYGEQVALPIPQRIAVAEACGNAKTIWEYKADGIEDVQAAYSALLERLLPKRATAVQTGVVLHYQQQVIELQHQLAEANEWRARHDLHERMDAVESHLSALGTEVDEIRELLQQVAAQWEKLRRLFDDGSATRS
jgi:chromosome partitioning protein